MYIFNPCTSQNGEEEKTKLVVISVSPQSRASLAAQSKLDVIQTAKKLTSFFKKLGKISYQFQKHVAFKDNIFIVFL